MKFFVDNCLAIKHARALNALVEPDHKIIHLRDKFSPETHDEIWLDKLAKEGDWIVISGDYRIGRSAHEKQAWHKSGLTAFFLAKRWMNLPLMEQHAKLSHCLPKILENAERVKAGSGFLVSVNGKIKQIYS